MSWIKMRGDLHEDPAVIGISARTGLDEFAVVGRLHNLWSWADRQSRDGHAASVTSVWVDRRMCHDGFAAAMVAVGWLVIAEGGIAFPNFERHNSASAKERAVNAVRQNRRRGRSTEVNQGTDDPSDESRHGESEAAENLSRCERDKNRTREEKIREESSSLRSEDKRVAALSVEQLEAEGVSAQTAAEFLAMRRKRRALLTPRAWTGIKAEAQKAGWSIEAALAKALSRGWQSVEAAWLAGEARSATAAPAGETAYQRGQRERASAFAPGMAARPPTTSSEAIDVEAVVVG